MSTDKASHIGRKANQALYQRNSLGVASRKRSPMSNRKINNDNQGIGKFLNLGAYSAAKQSQFTSTFHAPVTKGRLLWQVQFMRADFFPGLGVRWMTPNELAPDADS
jgi:hypothetical protein